MLKKGYLATNNISISYSHKKKNIDLYIKNFDKVIKQISRELKEGKLLLKSPIRTMTY